MQITLAYELTTENGEDEDYSREYKTLCFVCATKKALDLKENESIGMINTHHWLCDECGSSFDSITI